MNRKTQVIDATNKVLGRLAVEIAVILRGKDKPDFERYKDIGDNVIVKNFDKLKFSEKKLIQKKYYHHSGYLGGLKETVLKKMLEKKPEQVLKTAVYGMLPKNKLRPKIIKRLKFE